MLRHLGFSLFLLLAMAVPAFATGTGFDSVNITTTEFESLAIKVVLALATIWGIKKGISLLRG